ncbi:hypothetical protein [Lysobacter antibioticus]|uniref:Low-complexity protein n=1 Tax=Lysobacter antibioticus TaxID=84531 RepID=A0A0S2FHP5_LYSAN|nr:hypothetical protein [Lysobacter antibioticus]ALN83099.1 hypothetical protein LA76x_4997 [Lysobacter antibioticus]
MSKQIKKPVALAIGATLLSGLSLSASAFAMSDLSQGYLLGAQSAQAVASKAVSAKKSEGSCGGDKKHAEGGCGGVKKNTGKPVAKKAAEGKCGEGKCGGDKKGAAKPAAAKPTAKKAAEGKCGEGKCGGSV